MTDAAEQRWPPRFGPIALALCAVVSVLGGGIVGALVPGGVVNGDLSPTATDIATVVQDVGWVAVAVFLAARVAPPRPAQFGLVAPRSFWRAVASVPLAYVAFLVVSAIWFAALHSSGDEKDFVKEIGGDAGTLGVLAVCALVTVVAPICEELLFRGFIFRSLSNWRGPWPAALLTGAIFGAVHGLSAPAVDLLPLALLGVVLCAVYHWTGSLYPCIALHLLNNAFALTSDENWNAGELLALAGASLAIVALVLEAVRLASARWTTANS